MNHMWRAAGRASLVVGIAAVTLTCSSSGMESMGDAMVDAAMALRDAGADTLEDTGRVISDVGGDDAAAQPPCTTCTTGGATRAITADTDPAHAVGGVINLPFGRAEMAADGPLYLTDLVAISPGLTNDAVVVAVSVPGTMFCDDVHVLAAGAPPAGLDQLAYAEFRRGASHTRMHGGNFFVPAGRRLCLEGRPDGGGGAALASWSGFRPYE